MHFSRNTFVILVCSIHALYFFGSVMMKTYMNNDSPEYISQAYNIVHHGSFYAANWDVTPHIPEYFSLRPPLYSLMVLITLQVTSNPYVLLLLQSLLSIFIWLMLRRYALKLIPGVREYRLHLYLFLGLLFNPVQLILCNSIFSEILFQLLLTLAFFSLLHFIVYKKTKHFIIYIACCALALLTKPVLVYYGYLNIILAVYLYFRIQKKSVIIIASFIMPLIVFVVSSINKNVTGYYHYSSSKTINLWTYNTTNFLNMKYGNDSGYIYKTEIKKLSNAQPDFQKQSLFLDSACTHIIKANIKSYSLYHAQGVFNFFLAPGREFMNDYLGRTDPEPKNFLKEINLNGWNGLKDYFASQPLFLLFVNVFSTLWNAMLLMGLFLFAISKKVPWNIKLIALLIILYIAGLSSLALGTARYKAAIYPILLFCNAYLINWKRAPGLSTNH